MNHAPVHTTGEPVSPEAARELDDLDAALRMRGPLLIGADLADRVIKRYGRLPANCEVYVLGTAPAPLDIPSIGDLLPAAVTLIIEAEPRREAQWKRERNGRGCK